MLVKVLLVGVFAGAAAFDGSGLLNNCVAWDFMKWPASRVFNVEG